MVFGKYSSSVGEMKKYFQRISSFGVVLVTKYFGRDLIDLNYPDQKEISNASPMYLLLNGSLSKKSKEKKKIQRRRGPRHRRGKKEEMNTESKAAAWSRPLDRVALNSIHSRPEEGLA